MAISTYLSIGTLNVNALNDPVKSQGGWLDEKQDPSIWCLQETYFRGKNIQIENEVMEKDIS